MYKIYYNVKDEFGFTNQITLTSKTESTAKMVVARLQFRGHREAFYRYESKEEILAARREQKAFNRYGLTAYQTEPFSLLK